MSNEKISPLRYLIGRSRAEMHQLFGKPVKTTHSYDILVREGGKLYLRYVTSTEGMTFDIDGMILDGAAFFDKEGKCVLSEAIVPLTRLEVESAQVGRLYAETALKNDALLSASGSTVRSNEYLLDDGNTISLSILGGRICQVFPETSPNN